jgi:hypothetical protein
MFPSRKDGITKIFTPFCKPGGKIMSTAHLIEVLFLDETSGAWRDSTVSKSGKKDPR